MRSSSPILVFPARILYQKLDGPSAVALLGIEGVKVHEIKDRQCRKLLIMRISDAVTQMGSERGILSLAHAAKRRDSPFDVVGVLSGTCSLQGVRPENCFVS